MERIYIIYYYLHIIQTLSTFFKADENNKHAVTINKTIVSHGNEAIIKMIRDKHMKLTLKIANSATINIKKHVHHDVHEPILVFYITLKELMNFPCIVKI